MPTWQSCYPPFCGTEWPSMCDERARKSPAATRNSAPICSSSSSSSGSGGGGGINWLRLLNSAGDIRNSRDRARDIFRRHRSVSALLRRIASTHCTDAAYCYRSSVVGVSDLCASVCSTQPRDLYIGWQWRNFVPYLCQLILPPSCR